MFKKLITTFLIVGMICNSTMAFATDNIAATLTEAEKKALEKVGTTAEDLNNAKEKLPEIKENIRSALENEKEAAQRKLKEKLQEEVDQKIKPKIDAIKKELENNKEELVEGAKDIAKGYLFSTISLFAATLVGYQILLYCLNQPSGKIYAATAAIYLVKEIANFKKFKASALGSIKVIEEIKVNNDASLNDNINNVKAKIDEQTAYFKEFKATLDNGFQAIKNKADNAKMAAIGFSAAGVAAIAEEFNILNMGGACVQTFTLNKIKFLPAPIVTYNLDKAYLKELDKANKNEDRWALYSEWEMAKRGLELGPGLNEYQKYKKDYPQEDREFFKSAIVAISELVIPSAMAAQEIVLSKDLKESKVADYAGDLDKLGIVGAAAIILVAYMAKWQIPFISAVTKTASTRAIVFGAEAAIAYMAYKNFNEGADIYIDRLKKIDAILNALNTDLKRGLDELIMSDETCAKIEAVLAKVNIHPPKAINKMTIRELTSFLESTEAEPKLSSEDKEKILEYGNKLKAKAEEYDKKHG